MIYIVFLYNTSVCHLAKIVDMKFILNMFCLCTNYCLYIEVNLECNVGCLLLHIIL